MRLTEAQMDHLRRLEAEGGFVERGTGYSPTCARALERRGLLTCDRFYATDNMQITNAGRAAIASDKGMEFENRPPAKHTETD